MAWDEKGLGVLFLRIIQKSKSKVQRSTITLIVQINE